MRITKRQLLRIIREEAVKQTEKYEDDPALKGDQDELPDNLQKGIIDKEEEDEEKNEVRKLTRSQLRKMIQEQVAGTKYTPGSPSEPDYLKTSDEWAEHLGQLIDQDMIERNSDLGKEGNELVEALEMLRREYKDEMRGPTR